MKKDIILGFLLMFVASCASRKVDVVKNDSKTTVDSSVVVKTDSISTIANNIVINESREEIEYIPVDTSKCIEIDGKKYKNVTIKIKKTNKKIDNKTKASANKSSVKKLNAKREESKKVIAKKIDKKANYWGYLWLLIPIVIIILLERYDRSLFTLSR